MVSITALNTDSQPQTTLDRFYSSAPKKPYCSDDPGMGLVIRAKQNAFRRLYVQHNPPSIITWLTFDLDDEAVYWEDSGLPEPNIIVQNKDNTRSHISYAVVGVCTSDVAKPKPLAYLAAIDRAYRERLNADKGYNNFITKNPFRPDAYRVQNLHNHVYTLGELADFVELKREYWTRKRAANDDHTGLGRNCSLFHRLRYWAYDNVYSYRDGHPSSPDRYNVWMNTVLSRAEKFNDYHPALPYCEIKATAKSVGKWVWTRYFPQGRPIRRGAMADTFDGCQLPLDLEKKQRLAARRTNDLQRTATEEKIAKAINSLKADGKRVSMRSVAKLIGISQPNLSKHYGHFFKL